MKRPAARLQRGLRGPVTALAIGIAAALAGCAASQGPASAAATPSRVVTAPADALSAEVRATETAFARAFAERDAAAFARFIADDAVFINAGKPLRGKAAIVAHWSRWVTSPEPPFAWRPELVEVLESGGLGYSEGPVSVGGGEPVAHYVSIWRREADGRWRIVFDNGYDLCRCAAGK